MNLIHPTAIIHPKANIDTKVSVAPFVNIEEDVTIGKNTKINTGAVLKSGTVIGSDNIIGEYTVIGGSPQDLSFDQSTPTGVTIGNHNTISEFVTIHRSTNPTTPTKIGNHNLLMTQAHIAHDGEIHNRVVITNVCQLAGFVKVFDNTFISAHTSVHQFVKIGQNAMLGPFLKVTQDIPPFSLVEGKPPVFYGLNVVGLRRAEFSAQERKEIKTFYEMFYQTVSLKNNLENIKQKVSELSSIQKKIFDFINNPSKRGFITHKKFKR